MIGKHKVFLLLGSNMSVRMHYLSFAKEQIANRIGAVITLSSIWESEPWGFDAEMSFLNQVLVVETDLDPVPVLKIIQEIENLAGRKRNPEAGYISRTLDIDILFFDEEVFQSPKLTIPHPQIPNRRFTLLPLVEIDADFQHPQLKQSMSQLLNSCADTGNVELIKNQMCYEI